MTRLTQTGEDGAAALAPGVSAQQVLEKLARFEQMTQELFAQQEQLADKMEQLRAAGKEKSVQFRELFAKKLTNAAFLAHLLALGLAD